MTAHGSEDGEIVPLPVEPAPEPPAPAPSAPRGWLAAATAGMALFAFVGVASLLVLVTVSWPESMARLLTRVFALSVVAFMFCAAAGVFSAIRDSTPDGGTPK